MGFIRHIISFFNDVSLEVSGSDYNPHLEVLLVNGRHQLITKDAIYSFDDKYINFYESFRSINWKLFKPKNVLVLGLGLGSVNLMLEKHFGLKAHFTNIEIDPEIVRLAEKYTLSKLKNPSEVIITDALNYCHIDDTQFDFIIMDVFQSADVPQKFEEESFLRKLQSKLTEEGLLLYNRINVNENDKKKNKAFVPEFKKVFPNAKFKTIKDNLVLFSKTINHD